jgi:putative flippase GtrA
MKSSRNAYLFFIQVTGWIVLWVFLAYEADRWAALIIAIPIGVFLAYIRWKYWVPVLDEVRERRNARRKQRAESPSMN